LEIPDDLLVLSDEVAGRDNAPFSVAPVLPGQNQQPPAFDDYAVIEAARLGESRRVDDFPFAHLFARSGFCLFFWASNHRRWSSPLRNSARGRAPASVPRAQAILHSFFIIFFVIVNAETGAPLQRYFPSLAPV